MADKEEDNTQVEVTTEVINKVDPEVEAEQDNQDKPSTEVNEEQQIVVKDKTKIDILLKATANAPIMKKKKWAVSHDQHIGWISEFIKKYLKLEANERLFLYINQTFAPAPDQTVKNLYDCYGSDGKLIIHYCKSQAWG